VLGVKLMGIFSDTAISFDIKAGVIAGDLEDLELFVLKNDIDEIFYTMPLTYTTKIKNLVDFCDDVPVITLREEPLRDFVNRFLKRMFDLIFSIFAIVFVLSWLYPLIAILIKFSSKGPVLFKQARSGVNNEEFVCYKFRSMYMSGEADSKQAIQGDPRITKFGRFLRKSSLDEFPQFFNVFMGDMSIVGPRPHMLLHTEEYSELINKYMVRQLVKPGITGVAQVRGYRGETKELEDMEGRVKLDVWYIENWSLYLDINIIIQTIWNVFKGDENAY
jgi:exopolysaccharide biosynthesis polyprenyl glycosylphosphotransferase